MSKIIDKIIKSKTAPKIWNDGENLKIKLPKIQMEKLKSIMKRICCKNKKDDLKIILYNNLINEENKKVYTTESLDLFRLLTQNCVIYNDYINLKIDVNRLVCYNEIHPVTGSDCVYYIQFEDTNDYWNMRIYIAEDHLIFDYNTETNFSENSGFQLGDVIFIKII